MRTWFMIFACVALLAGCAKSDDTTTTADGTQLTGTIDVDGSSTVYPITEAVAEEFGKAYEDVRIPVGVSGTGGGFKRFCAGETAMSNASRLIKSSEKELCTKNGVEYLELAIAYDGLSVLVHPSNNWVDSLTVAELNTLFKPGSTVKTWKDVRASWPDEPIKIFSPGADSGTFDYFTEAINGKAQAFRNDAQVTFSEDDNTLVQGISGEKNAIGYFGFAYYEENMDKLKLVPIDNGKGAIAPSVTTIGDGTYAPLSRELYVYVSKKAISRPEVKAFTEFYLKNVGKLAREVGYIELPQAKYDEDLAKIQ